MLSGNPQLPVRAAGVLFGYLTQSPLDKCGVVAFSDKCSFAQLFVSSLGTMGGCSLQDDRIVRSPSSLSYRTY